MNGKTGMHDNIIADTRIFQKQKAGLPLNTIHINGGHVVFNFYYPGWNRKTHYHVPFLQTVLLTGFIFFQAEPLPGLNQGCIKRLFIDLGNFFLFLLFAKLLPVLSITEVKEVEE